MCKACEKNAAVSDSGLCGPCLRSSLNGQGVTQGAPVIAAHAWASCQGVIVPELVGDYGVAFRCTECGKTVAVAEVGLLREWSAGAETLAKFAAAVAA